MRSCRPRARLWITIAVGVLALALGAATALAQSGPPARPVPADEPLPPSEETLARFDQLSKAADLYRAVPVDIDWGLP